MVGCAVFTCKRRSEISNLSKNGVSYHTFPKDPYLRNEWITFCQRSVNWVPTRTSVICSDHFDLISYAENSEYRRRLTESAKPTILHSDFKKSELRKYLGKENHLLCPTHAQISSVVPSKSQVQPADEQNATLIDRPSLKLISSPNCVPSTSAVHSQIMESPRKRKLRTQLEFSNKKVKRLQAKNRYLKKKINNVQELLGILNEKSLIDKERRSILEKIGVEEKELLQRQMKKTDDKLPRTKYSPELRCFALNLNYYSPKAYKYVRKTFGTCLPHPRTLSKWYSHIDGKPGFTQEALNALKTKAEEESDKIYCALVIDEIKIKEHTEWDPKSQRHFGYVNHGFENETDNNDLATDSLVFLVVGINKIFKIPIGYFLVKGTSGIQKAQLVTDALALIHEAGVEIKALTCDGTRPNLAMAEELGCCLDPTKLQTTFLDPASGQIVHFFLDPCHMLKLIRNTFEHYSCLIKIKWSYLENLLNLQEKELFFLANKLKANHIYFKWKIMSVRLAAQLFSVSVADALLFCQNILKLPDFDQVMATANFIKLINDVFDILDSRTRQWGFKRALSMENYEKAFERLDEASAFILDLQADLSRRNGITSEFTKVS